MKPGDVEFLYATTVEAPRCERCGAAMKGRDASTWECVADGCAVQGKPVAAHLSGVYPAVEVRPEQHVPGPSMGAMVGPSMGAMVGWGTGPLVGWTTRREVAGGVYLAGPVTGPHPGITPREALEIPPPKEPDKVGWTVREYRGGAEVYRVVDGKTVEEPISDRDGLKAGDVVACPSLFGYFAAKIEVFSDGRVTATNGNHMGILEFDRDDRHCWTCAGTVNLAGLKRLHPSKEG